MSAGAAADDFGLGATRSPRCRDCLTSRRNPRSLGGPASPVCARRIAAPASPPPAGASFRSSRRLLGGYDSADIRWQDLKETRISAGILAADLTLVAQSSSDLNIGAEVNRVWTFEGLHKDQAQAMYRICQQHDQVWREKRRVRELEELRAKSGGVQIGGAAPAYGARRRRRGIRSRAAPASGARNARGQAHQRFGIRVHQGQDRLRSLAAAAAAGALLAQQMREVAVAQPIQRIGSLAQRAEQLGALAECLRHVLRLQRARLIERRHAAVRGREIVEVDQEIVPALFAGRGGLQSEHRDRSSSTLNSELRS